MSKKPIVYIVSNRRDYKDTTIHYLKNQYIKPLIEIVDCIPLIIPTAGSSFNAKDLTRGADGILITGGVSNVHPSHYGEELNFDAELIDQERDSLSIPLIQEILKQDIPMLSICRGFQELNVSCKGSLHQAVHELEDKLDHRSNPDLPIKEKYEEQRHKVTPQKGGILEKIGLLEEFTVNSVHQQGIKNIGENLFIEAIAEDGLIEAISVPNKRFALGVQWHPEGDFWLNDSSRKIFEAFKESII